MKFPGLWNITPYRLVYKNWLLERSCCHHVYDSLRKDWPEHVGINLVRNFYISVSIYIPPLGQQQELQSFGTYTEICTVINSTWVEYSYLFIVSYILLGNRCRCSLRQSCFIPKENYIGLLGWQVAQGFCFVSRVPQYPSVSCHSTEVPFSSVSSPEKCGLPN
jgi:hypothetical protein